MVLPDIAGETGSELEARYGQLDAMAVVELAIGRFAPSRGLAAISSFGADSAVLLHMIARVDRHLPVLFLDTGKHFAETLAYRDRLMSVLGLTNIICVTPYPHAIAGLDSNGSLFAHDPDACCALRKVGPMRRALLPFAAWFTGRKRYQSQSREGLATFEAVDEKIRINPLVRWRPGEIEAYLEAHRLPRHSLVALGYASIGCAPCSQPVAPGADARSGRWAGFAKTECGIHLAADGRGGRTEGAGNG